VEGTSGPSVDDPTAVPLPSLFELFHKPHPLYMTHTITLAVDPKSTWFNQALVKISA